MEGNRLEGYRVLNAVTVIRERAADVSSLLQAAIDTGATEAGNVRFLVADPKKSQMQGIDLAFQDARAKAEKLAALSNKSLGDVVSVAHQSYGAAAMLPSSAVGSDGPTLEAGVQSLSFDVSVVFELK